jgi:hypothetical protein
MIYAQKCNGALIQYKYLVCHEEHFNLLSSHLTRKMHFNLLSSHLTRKMHFILPSSHLTRKVQIINCKFFHQNQENLGKNFNLAACHAIFTHLRLIFVRQTLDLERRIWFIMNTRICTNQFLNKHLYSSNLLLIAVFALLKPINTNIWWYHARSFAMTYGQYVCSFGVSSIFNSVVLFFFIWKKTSRYTIY